MAGSDPGGGSLLQCAQGRGPALGVAVGRGHVLSWLMWDGEEPRRHTVPERRLRSCGGGLTSQRPCLHTALGPWAPTWTHGLYL